MTTSDDTGRLGLAMLIVLCVVAMRAFDQIDGAQFTQNLQWIISAYFLERIGSTVTGSVSAVAVERAKASAS